MNITMPYGTSSITLDLEDRSYEVLTEKTVYHSLSVDEQRQCILHAINHPVASPLLSELSVGKKKATIIISDHTRPVPSRLILPPMLNALRTGQPDIEITLLVATGCHRATTKNELKQKLGDTIWQTETIIVHDCDDTAMMVSLGTLPSGAELMMNRLAVETDLLLSEGFIEPHFFAGFSGGRKSVLPGVCGRSTVVENHCAAFIDNDHARVGILQGNPIHEDMIAAARMAKLQWITNVLLDHKKDVVRAVAGDPVLAHLEGCVELEAQACIRPLRKGDIVVTTNGGYPLDQNVYQCVKGMSTAETAAAKGAVIILCAECADGIGGEHFEYELSHAQSPAWLLKKLRNIPAAQTVPDQWQYQIMSRILDRHRVLFVTQPHLRQSVEAMHMTYCPTVQSAMDLACQLKDSHAHTVVIPDGVSVYCG